MNIKKISISLVNLAIIGSTIILNSPLSQASVNFKDISGHWAESSIKSLQTQCNFTGYTDQNGTPLNIFKPDLSISRGELVQMLTHCIFTEIPSAQQKPFNDVEATNWNAAALLKAKNSGWISGFSDGSFKPTIAITRQEAIKIILLSKFKDSEIQNKTNSFKDVSLTDWSARYISFATSYGFIDGYRDLKNNLTGYFGPQKNLTRAEAAKIITKVLAWDEKSAPTPTPVPNPTPTPIPVTVPAPTPTPVTSTTSPVVSGCNIFPANNPWNQDISSSQVHSNSAAFMASIGGNKLHPDFGTNLEYGIPFNVVTSTQTKSPLVSVEYADESDPGPYPIPTNAKIEGNGNNPDGDNHLIVLEQAECKIYELLGAKKTGTGWSADAAAIFDLNSNELRPEQWTSADAAGLPIFPGLIKYDEVAAGEINHAIRFTAPQTQKGYIHPATHFAGSDNSNLPPMGLRVRLKANVDLSAYHGQSLIILQAMKKYGMILADNGSSWYFQGAPDSRWNDEDLEQLKQIPGTDFEAVDSGEIIHK